MAQVTLTVNGTPYQLACNDGEEERLQDLAAIVDEKVSELAESLGRVGDAKLMLMAALLLLDEVSDQTAQAAAKAEADAGAGDVDGLASEIERIAAGLESA
ncbi:MAG: cell division protein ZapA [Alphaproteobacteria bacterium]